MPKIAVKKLDERAVLPTYGSAFSAGADLYAVCDEEIVIQPSQTVLVHTGLAMEIPEGYAGLIYARSGLACKRGLAPANKVGVVDADYRGEVMVALHNHSAVELAFRSFKSLGIDTFCIEPCKLFLDDCGGFFRVFTRTAEHYAGKSVAVEKFRAEAHINKLFVKQFFKERRCLARNCLKHNLGCDFILKAEQRLGYVFLEA